MKDTSVLNGMRCHVVDQLEAAFDKGYKQGLDDGSVDPEQLKAAYDQGLKDIWNCLIKISEMNVRDKEDAFDCMSMLSSIVHNFTPEEVISRLNEYEANNKTKCEECVFHGGVSPQKCRDCSPDCSNYTSINEIKDGKGCTYLGHACPFTDSVKCWDCPVNYAVQRQAYVK